jgi:catechol 2,3-dioxygenase-like lactoylglutathione lyase family enzyme
MDLGEFSISLSVQDLGVSRAFYERLGFGVVGGEADEGWLILGNGATRIGLFAGMFEENILTFNPPDVRAIQAVLEADGVPLDQTAEPGDGPASVMLTDPDGNAILLDQFE